MCIRDSIGGIARQIGVIGNATGIANNATGRLLNVHQIGNRKAMPPSPIDSRHPGPSRKALSMPSGGGLYGSSADVMSACGGFGTDRYQCSTMNLPVSHSVRPHPLVSSKEIDTHYDGRTGLGPIMSSAFYDNKRFSACH